MGLLSLIALLVGQAPVSSARLLTEYQAVRPGGSTWLAVEIRPATGWHSYWVNSGDSGLPLEVDWELPQGWKITRAPAPIPTVFDEAGGTTFGYKGPARHLFRVSVPKGTPPKTYQLRARADWMVCQDSCVMQEAKLSIALRVGPKDTASESARLLRADVAALPKPLAGKARRVGPDWILSVPAGDLSDSVRFLPDTPGIAAHGPGQRVERKSGELQITIHVSPYIDKSPRVLSGILLDGKRANLVRAPIGAS